MSSITIIGAGVAGLASAIRMAARGHAVEVFEANAFPGGKLTTIRAGEYRFDAGPSLFTMPQYFEELFALAGRDFKEYCPYERLEAITHYFYPDGRRLKAWADPQRFAAEVEEHLGVPAEKVTAHLGQSQRLFELTHNIFLAKSLHSIKQQSAKELLRAGLYFRSLDLFRTMHAANERRFPDSAQAVQLFDRFATYNGSDPYQAPATLNVIPHLEHGIGAFFPQGGMQALTDALYQLGRELGVRYHFNARVDRIAVEAGRVTGIETGGRILKADRVICNSDVVPAYRHLLKDLPAPESTLEQPRSSSALIFYWGVRREFPELGLHNIFFSRDYQREFREIFRDGTAPDDPTVYVNISSKYAREDAPPGCENWFVLVNMPNDTGQDWEALTDNTRRAVLAKLGRMLGTDIAPLIEAEEVLDPPGIAQRTGSFRGALYGSSSNNRMAAFLRHANFSNRIKGLYFCGGSVHPGGGIPLCMLSARIVDELMHG